MTSKPHQVHSTEFGIARRRDSTRPATTDHRFGMEGLSLPSYKQKGCGQADFPYLESILVFSLLMFLFGES